MLTVGSLFAGIGGFDLGFERSGFEVRWQAEQDIKAQAVLSTRFPMARLYDNVQTIGAANLEVVDVICGGFPCQDVSVAGKRLGLSGVRTGLFWEMVRIARELEPRWMVLENVPGILSSHGGRDFYTVLSALAELGFRRAYRILDSRYFGVPQRRRRVFIVLRARRLSDGAETLLFESESGNGDSQTGDETQTDIAATLTCRSHGVGGPGNYIVVGTLTSCPEPGEHLVEAGSLTSASTLGIVRRLTPLECERLQGFPDGWTCLCGKGHLGSRFCTCCDSHRYQQLGQAVTVPVAAWIARRILEAEKTSSLMTNRWASIVG